MVVVESKANKGPEELDEERVKKRQPPITAASLA
jgi:hypothetical protein